MKKNLLKKLVVFSLTATLLLACLGTTALGAETKFTDVADNAWYEDAVEYTSEQGIIGGTSATTFGPNESVTRGQFVTILGRLDGADTSVTTGKFTDVDSNAFYAPFVYWAADKGITSGDTATTFAPNKNLTREEMATLIANYLNVEGITLDKVGAASAAFADQGKISSWAKDGVELLQDYGLLTGDNANKMNPKSTISRAEAATVFTKLDKAMKGEKIEVPVVKPVETKPVVSGKSEWEQIRVEKDRIGHEVSKNFEEPVTNDAYWEAANKEFVRLANGRIDELNANNPPHLTMGGLVPYRYSPELLEIAKYAAENNITDDRYLPDEMKSVEGSNGKLYTGVDLRTSGFNYRFDPSNPINLAKDMIGHGTFTIGNSNKMLSEATDMAVVVKNERNINGELDFTMYWVRLVLVK